MRELLVVVAACALVGGGVVVFRASGAFDFVPRNANGNPLQCPQCRCSGEWLDTGHPDRKTCGLCGAGTKWVVRTSTAE